MVIKHVSVCWWRDLFKVGNSDRTVTVGAGIGFLVIVRGLAKDVSMACTS